MAILNVVGVKEVEKSPSIENQPEAAPVIESVIIPAAEVPTEMMKPYEFEMFSIWYSLPPFFRKPPVDKKTRQRPTPQEFCESIGVDDDTVLELANLPTITAFCERFDVSNNTVTEWKKKLHERDLFGDLVLWTKPLTRNVMMSLYNACLRGGLPDHYKLWLQTVNGWTEKSQIDIRKRVIKTVRIEVVQPKNP